MIQKPKTDPVIDEIHQIRREISDRFNGDVRAIAADANARMAASGCPVWVPADTHAVRGSGGGDVNGSGESSPGERNR